MNGAGMRPWRVFQPFLAVTLIVSLLLVAISAYVAPESLRLLRRWLTEVRTDLVSNIVQPGRFIPIESGLAFHIRERRPNGLLLGLMVDDRRDPKERVTILAERGEILKNDRGSFLILEHGSIQRHEPKQRDPNIVMFDRYAFDLSQFGGDPQVVRYSMRERYLWQLLWPDPDDPHYKQQPNQFRAELHSRLGDHLYPIAFVVIAFAFLGAPRTTRQSPRLVDDRAGSRGGGASPDRLCQHCFRPEVSDGIVNPIRRRGFGAGGRHLCHLAGPDHRAAGVPDPRSRRRCRMAQAPFGRDPEADAMTGTLARYFGLRFLYALVAVLVGVFTLIILVDYVEMMRRLADVPNVSAVLVAKTSLFRVPQIAERILPFCVLIGAMSCYLGLSRRLELVVSRAAGMSAWQFTAPAIIVALFVGVLATSVYNPLAAVLHERSKRLEAELSGNGQAGLQATVNGFWVSQRSNEGQSIINAASSREQGVQLSNITAFVFDKSNRFLERIEARTATLEAGHWRLQSARIYKPGTPPIERDDLPAGHQFDPGTGSRNLFDAGNRAVLAIAAFHRNGRTRRPRGGRLSPAIPEAFGAALHAGGNGDGRGGLQPATVPVRWRAEDDPRRRRLWLSALRHIQGRRRSQPG